MAASQSCHALPRGVAASLGKSRKKYSQMRLSELRVTQLIPSLLFGVIVAATLCAPVHAACEFVVVKQQIDTILDRDAEKAAKFRREVASGSDSIAVLESLVSSEMREKIDICRFDVAEYLTKRGFPPFH